MKIVNRLKRKGVNVVGEGDIFISPLSTVEAGATIAAPCHICGESHIEGKAYVGEGSYLISAHVCSGAYVVQSRIEQSTVGVGTHIGPYANVRGGCVVGAGCRIGDFVELKNARIGNYSKVAHMSYLGDICVGEHVNIGCGVVIANYDGTHKHMSAIEDDAFIGCNSNLISPVRIGRGAYVCAGTTVDRDVPSRSLCISRPQLYVKADGAVGRYCPHSAQGSKDV